MCSWQQEAGLWFRIHGEANIIDPKVFNKMIQRMKRIIGPDFEGQRLFSTASAERRGKKVSTGTAYRPFENTATAFTWQGSPSILGHWTRWGSHEYVKIGPIAFDCSPGSSISAILADGQDVELVFPGGSYSEQVVMCFDAPQKLSNDLERELLADYREYVQSRADLADTLRPDLLERYLKLARKELELEENRTKLEEERKCLDMETVSGSYESENWKKELRRLDMATPNLLATPSSLAS